MVNLAVPYYTAVSGQPVEPEQVSTLYSPELKINQEVSVSLYLQDF